MIYTPKIAYQKCYSYIIVSWQQHYIIVYETVAIYVKPFWESTYRYATNRVQVPGLIAGYSTAQNATFMFSGKR